MINISEVRETNKMIERENLDVRTITMGISLLDCIDADLPALKQKIYDKIYKSAYNLVKVGEEISTDYGIPIVNKRISVTPISLIGGSACRSPEDFAQIAHTLDKAAHDVGVNFLGGYSALVSKGMTEADRLLIESIPQARQRSARRTEVPSAAPNSSCSATRRTTILLWQALSMASRKPTGSSTSASAVPAS